MDTTSLLWALLALVTVSVLLSLAALLRRRESAHWVEQMGKLEVAMQTRDEALRKELLQLVLGNARQDREELSQSLQRLQQALATFQAETARSQTASFEALVKQLSSGQQQLSETLTAQFGQTVEMNVRRMQEMRATLDVQLQETRQVLSQHLTQLQTSNEVKLEEMRRTVDEKLHETLEKRVSESFKQVAERLEQVHRGLGEMQQLAQGVGDLKHLLTNVKTRGVFGEVQLGQLLEQVLTPEQYRAQAMVKPGEREAVDFAIVLPGKGDEGCPCWLPIDAKFPTEDYERLLNAQQQADAAGADAAGKALEQRIRHEAKSIAGKYISPPDTTDFAIMFLPTEGLYAEVLRRPGLMESLQREYHVTLTGPTTLLALLNSLQMGFRTLALEKRSADVWRILGAVKTEFGKFGDVLVRMRSQLQTVSKTIDAAETRTRQMGRALKQVETLPEEEALRLLPADKTETANVPALDADEV